MTTVIFYTIFILFPMLQSHDIQKANYLAYTKDNMHRQ